MSNKIDRSTLDDHKNHGESIETFQRKKKVDTQVIIVFETENFMLKRLIFHSQILKECVLTPI